MPESRVWGPSLGFVSTYWMGTEKLPFAALEVSQIYPSVKLGEEECAVGEIGELHSNCLLHIIDVDLSVRTGGPACSHCPPPPPPGCECPPRSRRQTLPMGIGNPGAKGERGRGRTNSKKSM